MTQQAAANTDRELYREPDKGNGSFYSDSIHVTAGGGIGINVGGTVIVRSLKTWHKLALAAQSFGSTLHVGQAASSNGERAAEKEK